MLLLQLIRCETKLVDACREHDLKQSGVEGSMETFLKAGERGLKARAEDEQAVHEREVRELRAKVGELVLEGEKGPGVYWAYEKAIRLDSELFDKVQSALQAETVQRQAQVKDRAAKAARAAAVSVRGSTPGTNTAPKAHSRRAMLEEAFEESSSRL